MFSSNELHKSENFPEIEYESHIKCILTCTDQFLHYHCAQYSADVEDSAEQARPEENDNKTMDAKG